MKLRSNVADIDEALRKVKAFGLKAEIIVLVQLKATQSNNLDFHLSYYLGKYDGDIPADVSFDIISNDKGFSPLIAHIKANGRACKQVKVAAAPSVKNQQVKVASVSSQKSKLTTFSETDS